MTNIFTEEGHLRYESLVALVRDELTDELARLEMAEHLAYCDRCLQRYTDLLSETQWHAPRNSCAKALWSTLRLRTVGRFSRRYAAAAAAVALALTLLWGSAHPDFVKVKEALARPHTPYTQVLQSRWDGATEQTASWLSGLMDRLDPWQERTGP